MNKDRYQSTSARRALALLNSPLVYNCYLYNGNGLVLLKAIVMGNSIRLKWVNRLNYTDIREQHQRRRNGIHMGATFVRALDFIVSLG